MGESVKLTKAQGEFLESMRSGPQRAAENYRPAQRVVELGLATRLPSKFGIFTFPRFELTDAGRAALPPTETPDA